MSQVVCIAEAVRKEAHWEKLASTGFVILLMAVLMVAACESTDSTSTVGESGGEPEEVSSSQKAIVIDYSVSTASELGGGFLADKPDTGYVYMIVHYNIRNQGHSEFSTNPWYFRILLEVYIVDIVAILINP